MFEFRQLGEREIITYFRPCSRSNTVSNDKSIETSCKYRARTSHKSYLREPGKSLDIVHHLPELWMTKKPYIIINWKLTLSVCHSFMAKVALIYRRLHVTWPDFGVVGLISRIVQLVQQIKTNILRLLSKDIGLFYCDNWDKHGRSPDQKLVMIYMLNCSKHNSTYLS